MKFIKTLLTCTAAVCALQAMPAQSQQFLPILSYRVGPVRGRRFRLLRRRDRLLDAGQHAGGINGVKLTWEECETEYNASKGVECYERLKKKNGGATTVEPLSTGIAYGLFDRVAQDKIPMTTFGYGLASSADGRVYPWVFPLGTTYWDQMAAMIAYLGQKVGGLDKLKGKKIAFRTTSPRTARSRSPCSTRSPRRSASRRSRFRSRRPGQTQESQWLQVSGRRCGLQFVNRGNHPRSDQTVSGVSIDYDDYAAVQLKLPRHAGAVSAEIYRSVSD